MMRKTVWTIFATFGLFLTTSAKAQDCALIDGLVDLTCDSILKIAVIGDSVVKGVGDSPKGRGGYVERLGEIFPNAQMQNLGVPGITSEQLYRNYAQLFARNRNNSTRAAIQHADIIMIDVGRNDFYAPNTPAEVARNVKRLVRLIRSNLAKDLSAPAPAIGVALLAPTNRVFQRSFITAVNLQLLRLRSSDFKVEIRADKLNPKYLKRDGLHPTHHGYDNLSVIYAEWINTKAQDLCRDLRTAYING